MTDEQDRNAPAPTTNEAEKQRLLGRIAAAAVVVVALLGGLALFDAAFTPGPVPEKVAVVKPPAVVPPAAEPAQTDAKPAEAAKPDGEAADKPAENTRAGAEPLPGLPPAAKEATARAASLHPGAAALPPVVGTPEGTAAPVVPLAKGDVVRRAEAARAAARTAGVAAQSAAGRTPPPLRPLAQAAEGQRGWALQLGIFSNPENAEELRQKLETAGIPAVVETRVRAGPFANRAEADAARAKLQALGIAESLLVAVKK